MLSKEEQLERRKFIGASEAAGVLGLSRWATPLSIWAEKTGKLPVREEESLCQWVGTELEEVVAKRFTIETGKKVHKVNEAFNHKKFPFLRCHIDRKVEGERSILQCKTATAWKVKEWGADQDVPNEYIVQELHELACSGYDRAYIAVLIGNQDFKIKVVDRDEKLIQDIVKKEVEFWNKFIVTGDMPIIVKAQDGDTLYDLFPKEVTGQDTPLDDEANIRIETLQAMKRDAIDLKAKIDQMTNEVKLLLKESESGSSNLWKVTWKEQLKKSYVVAESRTRVMRIKSLKEKE